MKKNVSFRIPLILCPLAFYFIACDSKEVTDDPVDLCAEYPDWVSSQYVLPYPVGNSFRISQGNHTTFSHKGTLKYSYDFEMPFGSPVTAARDGVVHGVRDTQPEGERGLTASNWIQIRHSDGMISEYVHLRNNSARFSVGNVVQAGDTIALTGDTGDVGTWPHLHFDINRCGDNLACDTEPVTFSNTTANPCGPQFNLTYPANPY